MAVVLHLGGATLSQALGDTIGVVRAPAALGARVGYAGSSIDQDGYAVVTSLSPYQLNQIDIEGGKC